MVSVRCTWLLSVWMRPNIPCCTRSSSFSAAPLRLAMMLAALCFIWSSEMSINVCRAPKMLRSMSTLQLPWSIDDCIRKIIIYIRQTVAAHKLRMTELTCIRQLAQICSTSKSLLSWTSFKTASSPPLKRKCLIIMSLLTIVSSAFATFRCAV